MEWRSFFLEAWCLPDTPEIMHTGGHLFYWNQKWVCSRILTWSQSTSSLTDCSLQGENRILRWWRNQILSRLGNQINVTNEAQMYTMCLQMWYPEKDTTSPVQYPKQECRDSI